MLNLDGVNDMATHTYTHARTHTHTHVRPIVLERHLC